MIKKYKDIFYFEKPYVYLIAKTEKTDQFKQYIDDFNLSMPSMLEEDSIQQLPEFAGRHCYMSFGDKAKNKSNSAYIKNIVDHKHFSVLEHLLFTFVLRGISRYYTHEQVRHRHLSFSQQSTRYCNVDTVVVPQGINKDNYFEHCYQCIEKYRKFIAENDFDNQSLTKRKRLRGIARFYLPPGIEAPIVVSGNLRSWIEVIDKRCSKFADQEIRAVCEQIRDILKKECHDCFLEEN